MNELENLRNEIDGIDKELLALFLKRMEVCGEVADYKRRNNMKVLDPEREAQLLEAKRKMLSSPEMADEVYEFFNAIMTISRIRQSKLLAKEGTDICDEIIKKSVEKKKSLKVVCYGYEGSYSEEAAEKVFGAKCEREYVSSFSEAFKKIEEGMADYTVLPIENSSTGVISEVLDTLAEKELYIVGEEYVSIRHCLVGTPDTELSGIKKLYSHGQGFEQCREYINKLGNVECVPHYSTALSARYVAELNDKSVCAIASERTAKIYGLKILDKNINTVDCNTTRFVVISKYPEINDEADKISSVFNLDHRSGELYRILSTFARGGLNLLKLESRPIPEKPFEYRFFADYSGNLKVDRVKMLTNNLINETRKFTFLGNYKNSNGEIK